MYAGEQLDERRLTGPILPDKSMHLAGVEIERHPVERRDATKPFRNFDCPQDRFHQRGSIPTHEPMARMAGEGRPSPHID